MFISKNKLICTSIFLSYLLGNYNLEIGFALKPFMISGTLILIILFISKIKIIKLNNYDYAFFVLSIYGGVTALISQDIIAGLRLFILSQLVLIFYLVSATYLAKLKLSVDQINQSIAITGFLFSFISLILYMYGLSIAFGNFNAFQGEDIYGLTIDRNLPRMIGLTFDPNFLVMFNIIFFFFLVFKKRSRFENFTLALIIASIILSLSRGGILAIAAPLIYKFFISSIALKFSKSAMQTLFFFLVFFSLVLFFIGDYLYVIIESRLSGLGSGSGRSSLINTMISLISTNPLFGVGWHNFRYYNREITGEYHYGHNTFLELFVELGLVGFIIYSIFLLFILKHIYKICKQDPKLIFLKYSFWSFMISMFFLSSIVNEVFFLFLMIIKIYYISFTRENVKY